MINKIKYLIRKKIRELYILVEYKSLNNVMEKIEGNSLFIKGKLEYKYPSNNKKDILITDIDEHVYVGKNFHKIIKNINGMLIENLDEYNIYIYMSADDKVIPYLDYIIKANKKFYPPLIDKKSDYRFTNSKALKTIEESYKIFEKNKDVTLHIGIAETLYESIELTKHLKGEIIEIGVYKGASLFHMLKYLNNIKSNKKISGFDTFEGFNYMDINYLDEIWAGTHKLTNEWGYQEIVKFLNYANYDFELIKGDIKQTIKNKNQSEFSLVHVDVDSYETTKFVLENLFDKIVKGGIMLIEDAASTPLGYGSFYAMEDFLRKKNPREIYKIFKKTHYMLIKNY